MDIQSVDCKSLVVKFKQLCHIRGQKMALNVDIGQDLDRDIETGEREILRRLEEQEKRIPNLLTPNL